MTILTATQDTPLEIIRKNQTTDHLVEIIDGAAAFLVPDRDSAAPTSTTGSGLRLTPGDRLVIEPREDFSEFLTAVGADMTLQVNRLGSAGSPKAVRRVKPQASDQGGLRALGRVQDTTPGANSDIFTNDIVPPDTGTLLVRFALDGASVVEVQETISGTTEAWDLLAGESVPSGEGRDASINVRDDASYNFHVESNVTVSIFQVDFDRRGVV